MLGSDTIILAANEIAKKLRHVVSDRGQLQFLLGQLVTLAACLDHFFGGEPHSERGKGIIAQHINVVENILGK